MCLTMSLGSARRQHHRGGGDSTGGKTEGVFLSNAGVPSAYPSSPLFLTLSVSLLSVLNWSVDHTDVPNHIQAVWL